MRKLASVQRIINIEDIPGADRIQVATCLGWKCVIGKNEFKVGDLVVFIEVDSFLPILPEYEFLRKSCYKKLENGEEGYRIKTHKFKGQISQGLILPLSTLEGKKYPSDTRENSRYDFKEGQDVTDLLQIKKYEPYIPPSLSGEIKGAFPFFLPKTDEIRIQSQPEVLNEILNIHLYISVKLDGTSGTFYSYNGEFGVCQRNLELKENKDNAFWKIAEKYSLKEKLSNLGFNIAIQGELMGPKIQGNKLGLTDISCFFFNVFDIDKRIYYDYKDFVNFCKDLGIKTVPIVEENIIFDSITIYQLIEMSKGYHSNNIHWEGIVIRPMIETYSEVLRGRLSFKIVNPDFLLKYGE